MYITAESTVLDNAKIYLADTDGSGTRQIATFTDDLWTVAPVWSPNSQQVALVRRESLADGNPKLGLWRLSINDGVLTKVPTGDSFRQEIFLGHPHEVISWSGDNTLQYMDRTEKHPRAYEININTESIRTWESPENTILEASSTQSLPCSVPVFNQSLYTDVM